MVVVLPATLAESYDVLGLLRQGGMAEIYRVRHRRLGVVRVGKRLREQLATGGKWEERFEAEAERMAKLTHPNIATIFEYDADPEAGAWIIEELIAGCSLKDILEHHGLPSVGFTVELARQGLAALNCLHGHGLVHRDVSPDNLMLTRSFEKTPLVKLIDLGIAKRLGDEAQVTMPFTFLGKARYTSPEQLNDPAAVDPRSDLYSFGVMLYQLLTGVYPIRGETLPELTAGHLFRPPVGFEEADPGARVPGGLREVVLTTLSKDPNRRPASALELARLLAPFATDPGRWGEELDKVLDATVSAAPEVEPVRTQAAPRRRPPDRTKSEVVLLVLGARAKLEAGDWTLAAEDLRRVLTLDPDHTEAQGLLRDAEVRIQRRASQRAAAEEVGALLRSGRLTEAKGRLEEAVARLGEADTLAGVRRELEAAVAETAVRVGALLEEAERRRGAADFDGALAAVGEALALDPADRRGRELRVLLERTLARQQAILAAVGKVHALLEKAQLGPATAALAAAQRQYGPDRAFEPVRARLAELERRQRQRQAAALLAGAQARLAGGEWEEAIAALRQALALQPDLEEAAALLGRAQAEVEERRTRDRLAQAVRDQLARGSLEEAKKLLADLARVGAGAAEMAQVLERELREKRRERCDDLLAAARSHREAGQLDRAAERLQRLAELDPDLPEAAALGREVAADRRRRERLREWTERLHGLLAAGRLEEAASQLASAQAELGPAPALAALAARIEEGQGRRRALEELLAAAERARAAGRLEEALAALLKARSLAPEDPDVTEELEHTQGLILAGQKRERVVQRARALLETGSLDKADELLDRAEAAFGRDGGTQAMRERIGAARVARRQAEITSLVAEARRRREAGDRERALTAVRQALALDPGHGEALEVLKDLEQEQADQGRVQEEVDRLAGKMLSRAGDLRRHPPRPPLGRRWVGIAAGVALVGAVVFVLATRDAAARLWVASEPPEAGLAIWIGGADSGQVTPATVTLAGEEGEAVEVELRRAGKGIARQVFRLGPGMAERWTPQVPPPPVALTVLSEPPGAAVILDGRPLGRSTPAVAEVEPDPRAAHRLRLELAGHEPLERRFTLGELGAGRELRLALIRVPDPGALVVIAPYPVLVEVAGRSERADRQTEISLAPGSYEVRLTAPDVFLSARRSVRIAAAERFEITSFPAAVGVRVFAVPSAATLRIDGRSVGALPREVRLVVGAHTFEFEWPGREPFRAPVEVTGELRLVSSDGQRIVTE